MESNVLYEGSKRPFASQGFENGPQFHLGAYGIAGLRKTETMPATMRSRSPYWIVGAAKPQP